jgi:hypothetical protein
MLVRGRPGFPAANTKHTKPCPAFGQLTPDVWSTLNPELAWLHVAFAPGVWVLHSGRDGSVNSLHNSELAVNLHSDLQSTPCDAAALRPAGPAGATRLPLVSPRPSLNQHAQITHQRNMQARSGIDSLQSRNIRRLPPRRRHVRNQPGGR